MANEKSIKTMYRANFGWQYKVEEFDITKETKSTVWFYGLTYRGERAQHVSRELKISADTRWFYGREQAVKFVIDRIDSSIETLNDRIDDLYKARRELLPSEIDLS